MEVTRLRSSVRRRRLREQVQITNRSGLLKFFRTTILTLEESDQLNLIKQLENDIKQIKDDRYRIGWYMRGSVSYHELMYNISHEDIEIYNRIIKDNIETTEKTNLPLI